MIESTVWWLLCFEWRVLLPEALIPSATVLMGRTLRKCLRKWVLCAFVKGRALSPAPVIRSERWLPACCHAPRHDGTVALQKRSCMNWLQWELWEWGGWSLKFNRQQLSLCGGKRERLMKVKCVHIFLDFSSFVRLSLEAQVYTGPQLGLELPKDDEGQCSTGPLSYTGPFTTSRDERGTNQAGERLASSSPPFPRSSGNIYGNVAWAGAWISWPMVPPFFIICFEILPGTHFSLASQLGNH